jgi:hypothetical protein
LKCSFLSAKVINTSQPILDPISFLAASIV